MVRWRWRKRVDSYFLLLELLASYLLAIFTLYIGFSFYFDTRWHTVLSMSFHVGIL
ncbi:hypothetical protein BDZ91DRAFT_536673 [Kalaharituber pfeilii]|nr:hypothetical protein BDZ91DRAFT_536673 [Kalaharituber pfeilii]